MIMSRMMRLIEARPSHGDMVVPSTATRPCITGAPDKSAQLREQAAIPNQAGLLHRGRNEKSIYSPPLKSSGAWHKAPGDLCDARMKKWAEGLLFPARAENNKCGRALRWVWAKKKKKKEYPQRWLLPCHSGPLCRPPGIPQHRRCTGNSPAAGAGPGGRAGTHRVRELSSRWRSSWCLCPPLSSLSGRARCSAR